jgi:hypothetical protein
MARGIRRTLTLSASQRAELERLGASDRRPYLRERAAAVLKIAAGFTAHRVARQGLLTPRDPDTVYAWLNAYERAGVAGLVQQPRGHRGFSPCAGRASG